MRLLHALCLVYLVCCVVVMATDNGFEGYKFIEVFPETQKDVDFLLHFEMEHKKLTLMEVPMSGEGVSLCVPPELMDTVVAALLQNNIAFEVSDTNVAQIVEDGQPQPDDGEGEENGAPTLSKRATDGYVANHSNYHSYDQHVAYWKMFELKYPDVVKVTKMLNKTVEGRDMYYVTLNGTKKWDFPHKPTITMEAAVHAREWISPATVLYFMDSILKRYDEGEANAVFMLDYYTWKISPLTNPDGYEYSRTKGNRLWRKNRRVDDYCDGVDLNRNYDLKWDLGPWYVKNCTIVYRGPQPFSEPETANLVRLTDETPFHYTHFSVHSYSQIMLLPFGYAVNATQENYDAFLKTANVMAAAINATSGNQWRVGQARQLLRYVSTGTLRDWMATKKPNLFALTFELRPERSDKRGFIMPVTEIIPSGVEFTKALEAFSKNNKDYYNLFLKSLNG